MSCTWASCLVSPTCPWHWTTGQPPPDCEDQAQSSDSAVSRHDTGSRSQAPVRAESAAPTGSTAVDQAVFVDVHLHECRSEYRRRRRAGNTCYVSSSNCNTLSFILQAPLTTRICDRNSDVINCWKWFSAVSPLHISNPECHIDGDESGICNDCAAESSVRELVISTTRSV